MHLVSRRPSQRRKQQVKDLYIYIATPPHQGDFGKRKYLYFVYILISLSVVDNAITFVVVIIFV